MPFPYRTPVLRPLTYYAFCLQQAAVSPPSSLRGVGDRSHEGSYWPGTRAEDPLNLSPFRFVDRQVRKRKYLKQLGASDKCRSGMINHTRHKRRNGATGMNSLCTVAIACPRCK